VALGKFSATVDGWVLKSKARMLAVFRESAQRTVSIAQTGVPHIPVDTGFARASVRASLEEMPAIDPNMGRPEIAGREPHSGVVYSYDDGTVVLTIANAQLGRTIFVGWTANYVGELEKGSSKQAPSGFVRLAAMQWQHTVSEVVAEAKVRAG